MSATSFLADEIITLDPMAGSHPANRHKGVICDHHDPEIAKFLLQTNG